MVKKIEKIVITVLVIAIVVSIVAVYYFNYSVKGTFNVTIEDKNHESLVNPDLPYNTFQTGETITLNVWVSGHTNPFLTNTIELSAGPFANTDGISYSFTDHSGNPITQGTIPAGSIGFGCYEVITISASTPAGIYHAYVYGTDNSGIWHADSYSFTVVS